MKLEIDISDDKAQNLSISAESEIVKVTKAYIEDLLDEASRLEESRRYSGGTAEVTAAIINDAVTLTKTQGIRKKKSKLQMAIQCVAVISSLFTGGYFDISKFTDVTFFSIFLTSLLITMTSSLYLIFSSND